MNHFKYDYEQGGTSLHTAVVTGSTLSFRSSDLDAEAAVELDLSEVVALHSVDHGIICVGLRDGQALVAETSAISLGYRATPYVNPQGAARRDTPLSVYRELGGVGLPFCYILTPFKGCSLADADIYWFVPADVTVNGKPLDAESAPIMPTFLKSWLPIGLDGPASVGAGDSALFTVSAPRGGEVYLEATAGVLSRARARHGHTVALSTVGLEPGTTARIKAGYKYWPGKTEIMLEVRATGFDQ